VAVNFTTKVVVENISMARAVISCMARVVVTSCWQRLVWLVTAVVDLDKNLTPAWPGVSKMMPHKSLN